MRQYKDCLRDMFGEHLHEYRISNAMTQEEIADELHIVPNAVSDLERKVFAPSAVTLMLFLWVLNQQKRMCFIEKFCNTVNRRKYDRKRGEFTVERITISEFMENPESFYVSCTQRNRIIRVTDGERSCIMMSDTLWELVEEAYELFLFGKRKDEGEPFKSVI